MEPRNYLADAAENPPEPPEAPSPGFPTDGNPLGGQKATVPGAWWIYKVGESLRRIITEAGLTPDDSNLGQLKEAFVSPQEDVDAGTDDNRFVTPKKLRWGFSVLLDVNGYIVFPTWMSGLIIQWGRWVAATSVGEGVPVVFPITFPSSVFSCSLAAGSELAAASNVSSAWTDNFQSTGFVGRSNRSGNTIRFIAIGF